MGEALKKINFTVKFGDHVWFDSTGAAVAQYEVLNWQQDSNGSIQFQPVGYYDASLPPNQLFVVNTENILWAGGKLKVHVNNNFCSDFKLCSHNAKIIHIYIICTE